MSTNEELMEALPALAFTGFIGILVILILVYIAKGSGKSESEENEHIGAANVQKSDARSKEVRKKIQKRDTKVHTFIHPWLATTLKGHSQRVNGLDLSINGKYAISCSEDRTVLIWLTKEFNTKEHKAIRANVELDHANKVKFSPDGKAFLVSLGNGNTVRIFKIGKKEDGTLGNISAIEGDFPKKSDQDIINIGISCSGKFIMTAYRDTKIIIWDLKGQMFDTIDTHQMNNNYACVSPCGRFVASCGFTPDVKVWEVCFTKSGDFKEVVRAFELKGHTAGVYSFAFNVDSTRMASVSKDGTWKLWDTDIEYQKKQDPYLLLTGKFVYNGPVLIALSSNGLTVCISSENNVHMYDCESGDEIESIRDIHAAHSITCLNFTPDDAYFLTAGDKHVKVFHNMPGYRAKRRVLIAKLKAATTNQPLKERLEQQISDINQLLGDSA